MAGRSQSVKKRQVRLRKSFRSGFTILEAGLAVAVASVLLFSVLLMVTESMRMRMEADRLSLAYTLASAKMTQILSIKDLAPMDESGDFNEEYGSFKGYKFEINVRAETIDLAKYAGETSEKGNKKTKDLLADLLPPSVQNPGNSRKKAGQSAATETGAMVPVHRIKIKITYPRGGSEPGVYQVETLKETKTKF
jgi:hypothetical protein